MTSDLQLMDVMALMSIRKKGRLSMSIVISSIDFLVDPPFRQRCSSRPFYASIGRFVFMNIHLQ